MHSMKVVSIIYISTQATNFSHSTHSMNKKKTGKKSLIKYTLYFKLEIIKTGELFILASQKK